MHKCDLNIIILGHDLHKNVVNFVFENFDPTPIFNPTPTPNPNPNPNGYSK